MKPTPATARGFDNVYDPSEDSFFLLDCLEKDETFLRGLRGAPLVAELGTGTGIVSAFVPHVRPAPYFAVASDVNPAACACADASWRLNWPARLGLEVVRGNLLDWMRPHTVDVLLFNPPYVPSESVPSRPENASESADLSDDRWVDLALDGGRNGMEITNRVLEELDLRLAPQGVAYVLFCASNRPQSVCARLHTRGWTARHIDTRRAGWEVLSVYRISKEQN